MPVAGTWGTALRELQTLTELLGCAWERARRQDCGVNFLFTKTRYLIWAYVPASPTFF